MLVLIRKSNSPPTLLHSYRTGLLRMAGSEDQQSSQRPATRANSSGIPEPLQLHFLQPAEGAAEGEGQVTLGVQVFQRHGGFQVERHAAVVEKQ